jgi:hypothetical protein
MDAEKSRQHLHRAVRPPISLPEQIPDHRERRDQQHAHDDAAADAGSNRQD